MSARPAVIGAFILGALALTVAGILFFGGTWFLTPRSRVVVYFGESVAGLNVGSPVTFHGVPIGAVESISLRLSAETMTARTPVYLRIRSNQVILGGKAFGGSLSDYQDLIEAGLRAQLVMESLVTGQLSVDLDLRPGTPARFVGTGPDVPEIPAVPSDLYQLRDLLTGLRLRELADDARQALTSVARLSDRLGAAVDPVAASTVRTADAATRTMETTNDAVRQLQVDTAASLHHLDDLLADARRQLDARGGELSQTLTAADRAARRAETLVGSLNDLAEPRSSFRDDLEAAARDLAASAGSLRGFAETIERHPNALLLGRGGH